MTEQLQKVFKKKEEIVSRKIAGETILVPIQGTMADMQRIFSLNPAAEYIWQELDGKKTIEEICNGIMKRFDTGKIEADADIQEFITELLSADLIEGAN